MPKSRAARLAAPFTGDSPLLPLFIICILSGVMLVMLASRALPQTQPVPTWAELAFRP